jgi:DNA-binding CsgD family transcriptional regulator
MTLLHGSSDLTSREWAITSLVSEGRTNAEIAAEMHTTKQVVEAQLRKIVEKTGCWNRAEVALWYVKLGLESERRFSDRRETNGQINEDRRHLNRRHAPLPSARVGEKHQMNLDE